MLRLFRSLPVLLFLLIAPAASSEAPGLTDPYSAEAFNRWLFSQNGEHANRRASAYAEFTAYLRGQNVGDVVPAWQLLRTDRDYAARCGIDAFQFPPRERWPAIVPALRLVRDEIVPLVGRVEVHAAWRSDTLNACVRGATRSRHLAFSALDLIAPVQADKPAMFADLCRLHRRIGAQRSMGLGTYINPARPQQNRQGRFHIDTNGYRSWGFDYTQQTSYCRTIRSARRRAT